MASLESPASLWNQAWTRYRKQFKFLITLSVVTYGLALVLDLVGMVDSLGFLYWIIAIPAFILNVWGALALYYVVAHPDEPVSIQSAFKKGGPYFLPSLITAILYGLIVFGGTLLLVIPGIYWAVLYGMANFAVFQENKSGGSALKRSKELVKGNWWAVVWRNIYFGLRILPYALPIIVIAIVISATSNDQNLMSLVSNAASLFFAPLGFILEAVLFNALVKAKDTASAPAPATPVIPA